MAPYIVNPLNEQILASNGSTTNVSCDADGFPIPYVRWVDSFGVEVSNTSLLQFSPVSFGDEGSYHCVASFEINEMNFTAKNSTTLIGKFVYLLANNTEF